IIFPILDQRGSVIAFGGRVLGEGETGEGEGKGSSGPKYLNPPETALFEKGRELYGLVQARSAIRTTGCVIVVEGYMDVVALAQHGIEYAVATLGTATSPTHVQKLLRQTDEVVFCFDGDAAGRKAALDALEGRARLVHEAKPLLQQISARALQLQLLKAVADSAGMAQDEAAQLTEIRAVRGSARPAPGHGVARGAQAPELRLVRILLQCL